MLKKEEYLKTVKRPYPPIFCSLVCIGYAKEELYKGIVKGSFSIKNMAHVDNVWYYGKAEVELGGKLALESWKDPILFEHVKKEFKKREDMNRSCQVQSNKLPKKKNPLPLLHLGVIAFPAGPAIFMCAHKHRISTLWARFIQFFNTISRNFVFRIHLIRFS